MIITGKRNQKTFQTIFMLHPKRIPVSHFIDRNIAFRRGEWQQQMKASASKHQLWGQKASKSSFIHKWLQKISFIPRLLSTIRPISRWLQNISPIPKSFFFCYCVSLVFYQDMYLYVYLYTSKQCRSVPSCRNIRKYFELWRNELK